MSENFQPQNWFEQLFGFNESVDAVMTNMDVNYVNEFDKTVIKPPPLKSILKSKVNQRTFNAGNFQIRSSDKSTFYLTKSCNKGRFHIIQGHGSNSKHYELIDILSMQSIPEFNGATYLAASNFNCLEYLSCAQTASSGVTGYYGDITQGPYTALACGPSIVFRNYFIKHHDTIGQINKEINLLEKTPIPVVHGYAIIRNEDDIKAPPKKRKFFQKKSKISDFWGDPKIWQVGVHRNCEVTMTRGPEGTFCFAPPGQFAHHVYAAAFNFASDVIETKMTVEISKEMLTAEYRAAILAAWENSILYPDRKGSKKLSLTLLGGGVFANPFDVICGAIEANIKLIKKSGLDVYLTCFNDETFGQVINYLKKSVDETNGKIFDTNDDESCAQLLAQ